MIWCGCGGREWYCTVYERGGGYSNFCRILILSIPRYHPSPFIPFIVRPEARESRRPSESPHMHTVHHELRDQDPRSTSERVCPLSPTCCETKTRRAPSFPLRTPHHPIRLRDQRPAEHPHFVGCETSTRGAAPNRSHNSHTSVGLGCETKTRRAIVVVLLLVVLSSPNVLQHPCIATPQCAHTSVIACVRARRKLLLLLV